MSVNWYLTLYAELECDVCGTFTEEMYEGHPNREMSVEFEIEDIIRYNDWEYNEEGELLCPDCKEIAKRRKIK